MKQKLVVIGNGMAGVRFVEDVLDAAPDQYEITIIGDETYGGYNRIQISEVLEGEMGWDDTITNPIDWYSEKGINLINNDAATSIDKNSKVVTTKSGKSVNYDKLVIATGSHQFVLPIDGKDLNNVEVFRTIDDGKKIEEAAKTCKHAVVIGGGMEGLEAAYGLAYHNVDVTVVELAQQLMPAALDRNAARMLKQDLEAKGIKFALGARTSELVDDGNGNVAGVKYQKAVEAADGEVNYEGSEELPADLVIECLGIRSNVSLAKDAGLDVNHGIIVNQYMQSSDVDIYAIGECAEFEGKTVGIVAPCYQQAGIAAKKLADQPTDPYKEELASIELKVPGIDLFSAGNINLSNDPSIKSITAMDDSNRTYKRVFVQNDVLVGIILYGDTTMGQRYFRMLKKHENINDYTPTSVLTKADGEEAESEVASMSDDDIICGCNNVSKGEIVKAIREQGLTSVDEVGKITRAGTSCGKCKPLIQEILEAEVGDKAKAAGDSLCKCTDLGHDEIVNAIRENHWTTTKEVFEGLNWRNPEGCNKCRPAINFYLGMCFPREHEDEKDSRWANERYLANIQRDGSYSVVPRMTGGELTPEALIKLCEIAQKYNVKTMKVITSQRMGLYGIKREDLPAIWKDINDLAGMESAEGYEQSLRETKACVGKEWCRHGTIYCAHLADRIEEEFKQIDYPKKLKLGISGCPRSCAEVLTKDFGVIGYGGQYRMYIGGNNGTRVCVAEELATVKTEEEVLEYFGAYQQWFRERGHYYERSYDTLQREGVKETIEMLKDDTQRKALYDRLIEARTILREKHQNKQVWKDAYEDPKQVKELFTSKDITGE
ncbi:MAG: NAD(P)/FAD-dependent oxidoreductase [Firmicutes bacterium]|uniref:NAD(P)/FAD-dependent oxidoreductase n=1 Tax=Candidatus Gallilactobacillus intestinavium TaxID=2840838 RepID=A0A9D9E8V2_9LACO|nr:NAD(P)/FAD-dependent oxidoreductase [Candidatus Gallilactobacillus intestinavium]